jgi:hypothetical protein
MALIHSLFSHLPSVAKSILRLGKEERGGSVKTERGDGIMMKKQTAIVVMDTESGTQNLQKDTYMQPVGKPVKREKGRGVPHNQ